MASTLYRMGESLNDNEEINNQFKLLKAISKKRNEMSTLTHANAMIKIDLFLLLVTNILLCFVL